MDKKVVDKNLVANNESDKELDSYCLPHPLFEQYGNIFFDKEYGYFLRLPKDFADSISWGMNVLKHMTPGGRTRFSTDASELELEVTYDDLFVVTTMPLTSSSGFLLVEDLDEGYNTIQAFRPNVENKNSFKQSVKLEGGKMRNYTLFWPTYNKIKSVTISLTKGAHVAKGKPYIPAKSILYYGSSITQGCCCSRLDGSYEALISRWTNTDFVNMGFSGNAFGELAFAEYLGKTFNPSIFVYDYDWNAPSVEELKKTHLPFFLKFREYHRNTPVIMLSMPAGYDNSSKGGERSIDRAQVIKETYEYAKKSGDMNVFFIDGSTIFPKEDFVNCTMDNCHPNDLGFYFMAKKLYEIIKEIL